MIQITILNAVIVMATLFVIGILSGAALFNLFGVKSEDYVPKKNTSEMPPSGSKAISLIGLQKQIDLLKLNLVADVEQLKQTIMSRTLYSDPYKAALHPQLQEELDKVIGEIQELVCVHDAAHFARVTMRFNFNKTRLGSLTLEEATSLKGFILLKLNKPKKSPAPKASPVRVDPN